ncbi:BglG family transcription antiterminator [Streptococcus devriesei]|uniref:BglG family transcription antiterminator n=1 Tax=Streptococcus devriesei TaxID=231233 RepID=UPI0004279DDE|nr:BglG family transcription antiterminator [Streptococcus devriesei]
MLSNELIKKFQIFSKYPNRSFNELEYILKTNKKSLCSDIVKINDSLQRYHYEPIRIENGCLFVPNVSIMDLFEQLFPDFDDYLFQEERKDMIILYVLLNRQFISNYHLQQLLRISKNSVLTDLKIVKKQLLLFNVQLNYTRQRGYYLKGRGLDLRRLLENTIVQLLSFSGGKWLIQYLAYHCQISLEVKDISSAFINLGKKYGVYFISEKMNEVCYLLAVLNHLSLEPEFSDEFYQLERVFKTRAGEVINELLADFPNLSKERDFAASRIVGCIQGDYFEAPDKTVTAIMSDIIELVRANTGLEFQDSIAFRKNLYMHLLPAYYRLLFDIVLVNPLKSQIMSEYSSLFYLIKKSLSPLEKAVGKTISDDEVAYFTIHFGGYLTSKRQSSGDKLTALSVCPNGISSSLIMQSELKQLFPQMHFKEVHQLDKIQNSDLSSYDLIFSTVYFENKKPVYVTQPLMNPIEKMILKKKVCADFQLSIDDDISIEELLAIISKHATIDDRSSLINDLSNYIIGAKQIEEIGGLGLLDLLAIDFIQQADAVGNWQEAIRVAAKPLLEKQYIEAAYIDGMIDSVNKLGAYIVLAPKVAVPHASPDYGVNKLGLSLLQLKEPVDFDLEKEGDPDRQVQLVFVLAAVDTTAHLKALQQLAMVLEDETAIEAMIAAEKKEDILTIIGRTIEKGEKDD